MDARTEITNVAAAQWTSIMIDELDLPSTECDQMILLAATYGPAIDHREELIMSDTRTPAVRTGDTAAIFYGQTPKNVPGRVVKVVTSRTGRIRRIGITPEGTDIVAWFAPVPDHEGFASVGGTTVAYV